MITDAQRRLFDDLLEGIITDLPQHLHALLEEVPLIVEDRPSARLLEEMGIDPRLSDLCGLHEGIALTRRSVEHSGVMPDRMMLFREPIIRLAGYRNVPTRRVGHLRRAARQSSQEGLEEQIRITLLHEIGHHFGLDEDDLDRLGYA